MTSLVVVTSLTLRSSFATSILVLTCSDTTPKVRNPSQARPPASLRHHLLVWSGDGPRDMELNG